MSQAGRAPRNPYRGFAPTRQGLVKVKVSSRSRSCPVHVLVDPERSIGNFDLRLPKVKVTD